MPDVNLAGIVGSVLGGVQKPKTLDNILEILKCSLPASSRADGLAFFPPNTYQTYPYIRAEVCRM
jgi:hypothetical protein